jgi:hypothetical protein
MADQQDKLESAKISNQHFVFTTESKKEVDIIIDAYKNKITAQKALNTDKITRI